MGFNSGFKGLIRVYVAWFKGLIRVCVAWFKGLIRVYVAWFKATELVISPREFQMLLRINNNSLPEHSLAELISQFVFAVR